MCKRAEGFATVMCIQGWRFNFLGLGIFVGRLASGCFTIQTVKFVGLLISEGWGDWHPEIGSVALLSNIQNVF